jgi:hypothetical protein
VGLFKISGAVTKRNLEAFLEKNCAFSSMRTCQFVGVNSSYNFSRNLLVPISVHNDIRNSWLALVKMEENAQFHNCFWLQHLELSIKLAQN